jgi:AraC family transcriptional regulator
VVSCSMLPKSPRTDREYQRRINAVLQFIDANLGSEISLVTLARVAAFSPFHFHRIFAATIGEPPAEFIRRLRLEKAARLLHSAPPLSVTEIALSCGFSTPALFSRLFRDRFGEAPSAWRAGPEKPRKDRQAKSKNGNARARAGTYTSPSRRQAMVKTVVRVEDVAAFRVAYVKHMKGYEDSDGIAEAFQKLFAWAGPRGFLGLDMRVLGISFDSPEVTPSDKCRYYACVGVSERAVPEGEVGIMTIRPGKYAVARFSGGSDIFRKAYAHLYGTWLPRSGWQPDDAPAFETYVSEPSSTRFVFDLAIPVKPL